MAEFNFCDASISSEALLLAQINNENGRGKTKMIAVEPTDDNYFDCVPDAITKEQWLKLVTGMDGCDEPAIRVGIHTDCACGERLTNCTTNGITDFQTFAWSVTGKDGDGNAYWRLCIDGL